SYIHHILKSVSSNFNLKKLLNKYGSFNPLLTKDLNQAILLENQEKYEEALNLYTQRKYVPGIIWIREKLKDIIKDPKTEKEIRIALIYQLNTGKLNNIETLLSKLEKFAIDRITISNFEELLTNIKDRGISLPAKYNDL